MAILLKTTLVRVSSIQIMQARVQNKGKSVWKSRYDGDISVALRLYLAAQLGTLIGSSIILLILIRNDRARDNVRLGAVARDVGEDGGARGGPTPRLILCRFALAE